MSATRLLVQLTVYYLIIFGGAWLVIHNYPEMQSYLPVGGAQELINSGSSKSSTLEAAAQAAQVKNLGQSLGWLAIAILGALITSWPVTWVYMGTRTAEEYDQSIISTVLILPSVVTSIVVVVQGSLALAFALGGIAGAVRFKNNLKSSGDALYILLSVGIGLASGIGAVELALVMSLAFNYCFMALWISEYGEREGMKRYMSDFNPNKGPLSAPAALPSEPPPAPPVPPTHTS
jgi:hypothetical protein